MAVVIDSFLSPYRGTMPRISDIEILRLLEPPVLSIETRTTPDALPKVIGMGMRIC